MSFLLVSGKQFICSSCEKVVRIEYKNSPMQTQVGDFKAMHHMELSQQYGQINSNPNEEGYYLYDFGLCSDCFAKEVNDEVRKKSDRIVYIYDKLAEIHDTYSQNINKSIPDTAKEIMANINPETFCNSKMYTIMKNKHILASKKEKQIKSIIRYSYYDIQADILKKVFQHSSIKEILVNYSAKSKKYKKELKQLIQDNNTIFISKRTDAVENLNDYIESDLSVRYPEDDSIQEIFYYEVELNLSEVLTSFKMNYKDFNYEVDKDEITKIVIHFLKIEVT